MLDPTKVKHAYCAVSFTVFNSELMIKTPSVVIGQYIGLDPYFFEQDNNLVFKLGTSDPRSLLTENVRDVLFPNRIKPLFPARNMLETYLQNEEVCFDPVMARKTANHWGRMVSEWIKQETWARSFANNTEQTVSFGYSDTFSERVEAIRKYVRGWINDPSKYAYESNWQLLQNKILDLQIIKPSDIEYFLISGSALSSLQTLVTLEWVRNVEEGFQVTAEGGQSLQSFSLYDAFV